VYFVPAFSGLFAPHWRDDARGVLVGLTRYSNKGHFARAVLEATAFQTKDVLDAMVADTGRELPELRVDGGMVANTVLMRFQADILGLDVVVPSVTETTVLGAAFGAGIASGVWSGSDEVSHRWHEAVRYRPSMEDGVRDRLLRGWSKAIDRSLNWIES
jgi:glycerol kinase